MCEIYNCDCIEGSKKHFKDGSMDLIICDPPFGINESKFDKHYKRDAENVVEGYVEAPPDYSDFSFKWISEAKRILKDTGSMYIISGWSNLSDILNTINKLSLYVENHIIWKYNFGVSTSKKFVSSHYHILYIKKSKDYGTIFNKNCRFGDDEKDENNRSLLYKDMEDVWVINKEYSPKQVKNQNKLPEELLKKIILYSSNRGDSICDFFLGNFTTAIVAKKLGRNPYGFEINKNSFDIFNEQLNKIESGCDLSLLRKVPKSKCKNRGKKLKKEEIENICKEFNDHIKSDMTKKDAIEKLTKKFGRGKFSILNILATAANNTIKGV